MSKLRNNPIMKGASGMFADLVVYRQQNGEMVMSNKPKKRSTPTDHQISVKKRFLRAVQYAKAQMLDAASKAEYEAATTEKLISGYAVAVADFLRAPEIDLIEVNDYAGIIGNSINILAFDNFKVVGVSVEIRSAANVIIEQGAAVQDPADPMSWTYTTTVANNNLPGTKVIVRAKDKPKNTTVKEVVLV
jgi:hypothetical protein